MTPFRLFSLLIFIFLAIYEAGNLTGFSWERFEYVPENEIVDAAVRYEFGEDVYANFEEMQRDYSKFTPQVRYWGSWTWRSENSVLDKLLGFEMYQVKMPEGIVLVTVDGKGHKMFSEDCQDHDCPVIPPDNPEQGIVGTLQLGRPTFEITNRFKIRWDGKADGSVFISGHCFSAYTQSPANERLVVTPAAGEPFTIRKGYGFYLVAAYTDGTYASMRISKAEFLKSKTCSKEAREAWPNVGGGFWKR